MTTRFPVRLGLAAGAFLLSVGTAQACGPNPVMGSICFFAFSFCPEGYAPVMGQEVEVSDDVPYSKAMFSLVQDYFGQPSQDGAFLMPDLQGRMPIGTGTSQFQEYIRIGIEEGNDSHLLFPENLPHVHDYVAHVRLSKPELPAVSDAGTLASPRDNVFAAKTDFYSPDPPNLAMESQVRAYFETQAVPGAEQPVSADQPGGQKIPPVLVTPAGNPDAQPLPLRPPQMALTACIAVSGRYPPRS